MCWEAQGTGGRVNVFANVIARLEAAYVVRRLPLMHPSYDRLPGARSMQDVHACQCLLHFFCKYSKVCIASAAGAGAAQTHNDDDEDSESEDEERPRTPPAAAIDSVSYHNSPTATPLLDVV